MSPPERNILGASGLNPVLFVIVAFAPPVEVPGRAPLPAILTGTYRGHNAAIRAWPVIVDGEGNVTRWDALAFVSAHPAYALNELSNQERERLRAESLTALGESGPVGQDRVLDQPPPTPAPPPDPVPYAPELPVLEGEAEDIPESEVVAEPLECGPACIRLSGPEGTMEEHGDGCTAS